MNVEELGMFARWMMDQLQVAAVSLSLSLLLLLLRSLFCKGYTNASAPSSPLISTIVSIHLIRLYCILYSYTTCLLLYNPVPPLTNTDKRPVHLLVFFTC